MEENKIIIYQTEDGQTQIDVRLEQDMIWLTRQQLADMFGRDYKTISKHINNAIKEELADSVVVAKFANTTQHGAIEGKTQTHEKDYLNLYDSGTCPHGYGTTIIYYKGFCPLEQEESLGSQCQNTDSQCNDDSQIFCAVW